jgi:hypothetical protein
MKVADAINKEFGNDNNKWRATYTIKIRGDKLYWLLWLAEIGIYAKQKFATLWSRNTRPSEKAASLASWQMDVEHIGKEVLRQVRSGQS